MESFMESSGVNRRGRKGRNTHTHTHSRARAYRAVYTGMSSHRARASVSSAARGVNHGSPLTALLGAHVGLLLAHRAIILFVPREGDTALRLWELGAPVPSGVSRSVWLSHKGVCSCHTSAQAGCSAAAGGVKRQLRAAKSDAMKHLVPCVRK